MRQRVLGYLKSHWLALFSAFVLGLGFPLWKMFVWETPDVYVEITGVDKSPDSVQVNIRKEIPFRFLLSGTSSLFFPQTKTSDDLDLAEVENRIGRKEELLANSEKEIGQLKKLQLELEETAALTAAFANRLNEALSNKVEFQNELFAGNDRTAFENLRQQFLARLRVLIQQKEQSLEDSRQKISAARNALSEKENAAATKEARIRITCAVSNAGAGAISLKPQALLRVYLGGNNYFDVELEIEDQNKSDLPPRSSKVVRFQSDPLESMRVTEEKQINSYFTQNVPARLFLIDIKGGVHKSDTVPFAQGLYKQTIYDRLRREASEYRTNEL